MIVHFRGELQHMSTEDLESLVPADAIVRIKAMGVEHPTFKVFSVGHEGEAEGRIVGRGRAVMQYLKDAICKIADKLSPGLAVFDRHGMTNEHSGRRQIGEIVGRAVREIGKRTHALAAVWVYPAFRDAKHDIASIEADVVYAKDASGNARVEDVTRVTGVALSNRGIDAPGFPGATLLGAFQAFQGDHPGKGDEPMDKNQVIEAIKALKLQPSDVFEKDALVSDETFRVVVREKTDAIQGYADRQAEKVKSLQAQLSDREKALEADIAAARAEAMRAKVGEVFGQIAVERKLEGGKRVYVERRLGEFKSDAKTPADLRADLQKFLDAQQAAYDADAKIFGVATGDGGSSNGQAGGGRGVPAGDKDAAGASDPNDLTDPKNNDFIPE